MVLNVGGMEMHKALPEADQINFLPRVTQPVLMLNGKHDMFFPVKTSQKPMFDLLGTPAKDKKIFVYESGHLVPRTDFVPKRLPGMINIWVRLTQDQDADALLSR